MAKTIRTPKGSELPLLNLKGKDYLMVAYRLQWLTEQEPFYTINTKFLKVDDEQTVAKATITIFNDQGKVVPAVQFLYQMVETFNMSLKDNYSNDLEDYLVPIFCSARPDDYRKVTEEWLCENGVGCYDRLIMRGRNDYRRDDLVKEQMLDFEILPRYKIEFWCDDRDQVVSKIRSRGIPVFQVAPGEF